MMDRFAYALAVGLLWTATASGWRVEGFRDPFTGDQVRAARATSDRDVDIRIFRSPDGKVRVVFSLPRSRPGRFPRSGELLTLTPGDRESRVIAAERSDVVESARSDGINARSLLWHGEGKSPTGGMVRDVLDSRVLRARIRTEGGRSISTAWTLNGAAEALTRALGIAAKADPDLQAWERQHTDLFIRSTRRCEGDLHCLEVATSCLGILERGRDVRAFKQCLAGRGFALE